MAKKDIQSRGDSVTKDMSSSDGQLRTYRFPGMGATIEAKSLADAIAKIKGKTKAKKEKASLKNKVD